MFKAKFWAGTDFNPDDLSDHAGLIVNGKYNEKYNNISVGWFVIYDAFEDNPFQSNLSKQVFEQPEQPAKSEKDIFEEKTKGFDVDPQEYDNVADYIYNEEGGTGERAMDTEPEL